MFLTMTLLKDFMFFDSARNVNAQQKQPYAITLFGMSQMVYVETMSLGIYVIFNSG